MKLEKELAFYNSHKNNWISAGKTGKFVVIKDGNVLDFFLTYEDALRQGLKAYGNTPFLIKEISAVEQVNFFNHGVNLDPCPA